MVIGTTRFLVPLTTLAVLMISMLGLCSGQNSEISLQGGSSWPVLETDYFFIYHQSTTPPDSIACLIGGRWGRAPATILYSGWVHHNFGMGELASVGIDCRRGGARFGRRRMTVSYGVDHDSSIDFRISRAVSRSRDVPRACSFSIQKCRCCKDSLLPNFTFPVQSPVTR